MRRDSWKETLAVVGTSSGLLITADLISHDWGPPLVIAALAIFTIGTIVGEQRASRSMAEAQSFQSQGLDGPSPQAENLEPAPAGRLH